MAVHELYFFGANWKRQQGSPLHVLKDYQKVTLQGVGVMPDVLTHHVGPVYMVLFISQDRDNDLKERHTKKARGL